MAISVVMPALEMAQETGKLISWLKKEGESVAKEMCIRDSPEAAREAMRAHLQQVLEDSSSLGKK